MKKLLWGVFGLIVILGVVGGGHTKNQPAHLIEPSASSQTSEQPVDTSTATTPDASSVSATSTSATGPNLSNDNTYTNVDGATVHSPAYSTDNSVPTGAKARCGDGTYSFSQHRSGTCSHHGGVAEWL